VGGRGLLGGVGSALADGTGMGVSAGDQGDNGAPKSWVVYGFGRSGTCWRKWGYVKASNTGPFDDCGYSVAVEGQTIVASALSEDSPGTGVNSGAQADNSAPDAGAAFVFDLFDLGTSYCTTIPNSTGVGASIGSLGSSVASSNDVTLGAQNLPPNTFGFALNAQTSGFFPNAGGSFGNLCLSGAIGRYAGPGQIMSTGAGGSLVLRLDLANTPQPTGPVSILAGQTWYFQVWYRDTDPMGSSSSNFTPGLQITFD